MNSIRRHHPGWVDAQPAKAQFESTEEMLRIPWIAAWNETPEFERFAVSEELLMAEMKDGSNWVIGYIADPSTINLPPWRGRERDNRKDKST